MSKSYQAKACFVSLVILSGCESEGDKLQRLTTDQATACLGSEVARKVYTDARYPGGLTSKNFDTPLTPETDSLGKAYLDQKTKCELATREYNRFMR